MIDAKGEIYITGRILFEMHHGNIECFPKRSRLRYEVYYTGCEYKVKIREIEKRKRKLKAFSDL